MSKPSRFFESLCIGGLAVSALLGTVAIGRATPIAYDGFSYSSGTDLSTDNGGIGWSGAWIVSGSGTVHTNASFGLSYPAVAVVSNSVYCQGNNASGGAALITYRTF